MRRHHDDLTAWADDPVVQALQAPASADELAGLDPLLAEFHRAVPPRSRRRLAHRVGTGATTVIVAIGLTGGVAAAAYTRTLPAPLQSAMHSLLGPVGVPAADPLPHPHLVAGARGPSAAAARPRSLRPLLPATSPAATASTVAAPKAVAVAPRPASAPATTAASGPPAPTSSPAAAPQPAPSPTASSAPAPATLTAKPGRVRVPFNQRVGVKGTLLTASGAPVAGHRVYLQQRPHGTSSPWSRVAAGRTRADGTVVLRTPALARNVDVRLVTPQGLHSTATKLTVLPHVAISLSKSPNGKRYVVTVTVTGAQTGDSVSLARRSSGSWSRIATKQLPDSSQLTFSVLVPTADVHYRIRVTATAVHGDGYGFFTASAS